MNDRQLEDLIDELLDELHKAHRGGLVVRLSDAQLDEIAERVFARVDERLSAREPLPDAAPRRGLRGR